MSAKSSGTSPHVILNDKNKKWQMELLMERLRTKASQHKTFPELSKAMRMSMLEKRYALDTIEKSNLQKCLDSMQHCIKVTSRQGLVERLESLSRQLGLKFMDDTSGLFISSDMFYVEIMLDSNGKVHDVKVHHECKIEHSCKELVTCLLNGDFADFTSQLEGLASIYQLNADPKIKTKAFVALQALETDLANLFALQNFYQDPYQLLMQSAIGILQKRRGGHPMKLTYFVSPYQLLDVEKKMINPLSVELISTKNIGSYVTVNLESSAINKLQILPLLVITKDIQGRNTHSYAPISNHNYTMLPATFVLRLNAPMPLCSSLARQIHEITEISGNENASATATQVDAPMLALIAKTMVPDEPKLTPSKGLFIALPDQKHCYFMTENSNLNGTVINSVPFTEPSHVPLILKLLRQQIIFNTLISSCVRVSTSSHRFDLETTTMFELNAVSTHHISVTLEHPFEESIATVEFIFNELGNISCKIYSLSCNYELIASKLTLIIQKTMSIPVTLRALLHEWNSENKAMTQRSMDGSNFSMSLGPSDPGGSRSSGNVNDFTSKSSNGNGYVGTGGSVSNVGGLIQNPMGMGTSFNADPHNNPYISNEKETPVSTSADFYGIGDIGANPLSNSNTEPSKKRRRTEDFWMDPKSEHTHPQMPATATTATATSSMSSVAVAIAEQHLTSSALTTPPSDLLLEGGSNSSTASSSSSTTSASTNSSGGNALNDSNAGGNDSTSLGNNNNMNKSEQGVVASQTNIGGGGSINTFGSNDGNGQLKDEANSTTMFTPSVSITAINTTVNTITNMNSVLSGMGLERRPGIEIIPIASTPSQSLPSSITITPINAKPSTSSSNRDKKQNSKKQDIDSKSESKKRKRKRDDIPMGPPEKITHRSEIGSRPANVTGATKSPAGTGTLPDAPLSPSHLMRKFSSSPLGKSKVSPKHSPGHHSSPKHQGLHSPKQGMYGIASPKQSGTGVGAAGGSGKPSMSALKSAASSPSSKSAEKTKKDSKEKDGKKYSSGGSSSGGASPKIKSSSVKLKQLDLSAALDNFNANNISGLEAASLLPSLAAGPPLTTGHDSNSSSSSSSSSSTKNNEYMVKPSSDGIKITINKTRTKEPSGSPSHQLISTQSSSKVSSPGLPSSSKSSGIKSAASSGGTTTKSKSATTSKSSSSQSSKLGFQKSHSFGSLTSTKTSKTSSGSSSDPSRKDNISSKSNKSSKANATVDVMKMLGLTTNAQTMDFIKTLDTNFQIPKLSARSATGSDSNSVSEKKDIRTSGLNSSSLSAPNTPSMLQQSSPTGNSGFNSNDSTTKMIMDFFNKDNKYNFPLKMSPDQAMALPYAMAASGLGKIPGNSNPLGHHSPSNASQSPPLSNTAKFSLHTASETVQNFGKEFVAGRHFSMSNPSTPTNTVAPAFPSPLLGHRDKSPSSESSTSSTTRHLNNFDNATFHPAMMRPPSAPPNTHSGNNAMLLNDASCNNKAAEGALDFSTAKMMNNQLNVLPSLHNMQRTMILDGSGGGTEMPHAAMRQKSTPPSVQVHIVKSPVPSPLVIPSPHPSNSPCITDEELLDETLVGIGGK